MRFARLVFAAAGVWGLLVVPPLYFLYDLIGEQQPPAITHPEYYYGFTSVTLAWQIAFLAIATDPRRFRPLMIPAMLEKFLYVASIATLFLQGRVAAATLGFGAIDALLGILFVAAFLRTPASMGPRR